MSNIRQPKWLWSCHTPKMIELYNSGMSIPDIHKAIQSDGFEPCQRSVYTKFRSMGYPTDPVARSRRLDAHVPLDAQPHQDIRSDTLNESQSPEFSTAGSGLYTLPEDDIAMESTYPWSHTSEVGSPGLSPILENPNISRDLTAEDDPSDPAIYLSGSNGLSVDAHGSNFCPIWVEPGDMSSFQNWSLPIDNLPFDQACEFPNPSMELNGAAYFSMNSDTSSALPTISSNFEQFLMGTNDSSLDSNKDSCTKYRSLNSSSMDVDNETNSFTSDSGGRYQRKTGHHTVKAPFPNLINNSNTAAASTKFRSLFKSKLGSSHSKKKYATSQYTYNTEDSGYASGYTSCLTLDSIQQAHPQSLNEFNGLYRVACHSLHEPPPARGMAKCRDIPTCRYCRYSSIHNLGWSSRYLKFEVFLSELRLTDVYEFGALDAAGNTALHYAAAGGGNFRHLKALIDAGVDPYAANTAGELFLYCLRPLQPFTLELNSDCLKGNDLIVLLELLQPDRIFGWRDNNGQTILHALALKIANRELKAKIFTLFSNAGYNSNVPDRFGNRPHDIVPLDYDCHGQVIGPAYDNLSLKSLEISGDESTTAEITPEWSSPQVKKIQSQDIVLQARNNPTYVDPESGDNVLHALSRLKSSNDVLLRLEHFNSSKSETNIVLHNRQGNQILLNLEYIIPRGVDLNLHNREGSHPLRSFLCDRPAEEHETGATISKYLDRILWKDSSSTERVSNDINVNMKDREGATALHHAAICARPDAVRSLLEAGANANARADDDTSVLQATCNALDKAAAARLDNDGVRVHLLKEVISYLEHAGAVLNPSSLQERRMRKL